MAWLKFHQSLLSWSRFHHFSINTKVFIICVFTIEVEPRWSWFLFFTFYNLFFTFEVGIILTFVVDKVFTFEGDFHKWGWFITFVVDFDMVGNFGCNKVHSWLSSSVYPINQCLTSVTIHQLWTLHPGFPAHPARITIFINHHCIK